MPLQIFERELTELGDDLVEDDSLVEGTGGGLQVLLLTAPPIREETLDGNRRAGLVAEERCALRFREGGKHTFIDKVKVRLVDSQYGAEVTNFGHKHVHVPDHYVRDVDRLLTGGIWAQVDMRFEYDEETKGGYPFWIDKLSPIHLATLI